MQILLNISEAHVQALLNDANLEGSLDTRLASLLTDRYATKPALDGLAELYKECAEILFSCIVMWRVSSADRTGGMTFNQASRRFSQSNKHDYDPPIPQQIINVLMSCLCYAQIETELNRLVFARHMFRHSNGYAYTLHCDGTLYTTVNLGFASAQ